MSALTYLGHLVAGEEVFTDSEGITTHHWLWPEQAEIIYGILASVIIFGFSSDWVWSKSTIDLKKYIGLRYVNTPAGIISGPVSLRRPDPDGHRHGPAPHAMCRWHLHS